MYLSDLVIQVFMGASLIAGISMMVFTIGYVHELRRVEIWGRCVLATLLLYSVSVRYYFSLPSCTKHLSYKHFSIPFDVLYISLCVFYVVNILLRREGK